MDTYKLCSCGECNSCWIIEGAPERTNCRHCGKQHKIPSCVIYSADNKEKVKQAKTIELAKRYNTDEILEDLLDQERFFEDVKKSIARDKLLEEEGVKEEVEQMEDMSKSEKETAVKNSIKRLNNPTDEDIIHSLDGTLPEEDVENIIDKLCMEGIAIRTREGTISLV